MTLLARLLYRSHEIIIRKAPCTVPGIWKDLNYKGLPKPEGHLDGPYHKWEARLREKINELWVHWVPLSPRSRDFR